MIRQTRFGDPDGNCLEACIASITGIDLDSIPHFDSPLWMDEYTRWLSIQGWNLAWWRVGQGSDPPGLSIANGLGPRGLDHSVVYLDGVFHHDPHPSDAGLVDVHYWTLIWRQEPRP